MTSPTHPAWTTQTRKAARIAQDDQNEAFLASKGIAVDDPLFRLTQRQRMAVSLLASGAGVDASAARMGIVASTFRSLLVDAFAAMGLDGDWPSNCARAGFLIGRRAS